MGAGIIGVSPRGLCNYDIEWPHIQRVPADVKDVQLALAVTNAAAKNADPNRFVDNHWVEALDKTGFIATLYK